MKQWVWENLSTEQQHAALLRPALSQVAQQTQSVQAIIDAVRQQGDAALFGMAEKFDKVQLTTLRVDPDTIAAAHTHLAPKQMAAIERAADNIRRFHRACKPQNVRVETETGVSCEKQFHAIERVGLYVPGGSAPLPSTVLMTAIPAQIAGCSTRILCTPPLPNGGCHPAILAAAHLCDIRDVFLVGGAGAIAAMAYGSETIAKVDKIFGPGNSWVTRAKTLVCQDATGAAIDMPAGPSEVMVIADDSANPQFIAADLLSQAEHGADSQAFLLSDSKTLITQTLAAVSTQCAQLSRRRIAEQALSHSAAILVDSMEQAILLANRYAPEHLILNTRDLACHKNAIRSAGSVFLGPWAPESMGDYASGTNHVLPTYGFARAYSGLSVTDFMRATSMQTLTAEGFAALADTVSTLATLEGLDAHAAAVTLRQRALDEEQHER